MSRASVPVTGPVVVEVDGSVDGLRVIDFAARAGVAGGTGLVLVRPYRSPANAKANANANAQAPPGPAGSYDEADRDLRVALTYLRRHLGHGLPVRIAAREGGRLQVLAQFGRTARLLVVPRQRVRGPQRLLAAQADLALTARSRCPVIVVPRSWKPSGADAAATRVVGVPVEGDRLVVDTTARWMLASATCPVALVRQQVAGVREPAASAVGGPPRAVEAALAGSRRPAESRRYVPATSGLWSSPQRISPL